MIFAPAGVRRCVRVDIWSDVVCPWCYIGKRRFEAALARFDHRDEVVVQWHSFELDPQAPSRREGSLADRMAAKFGMSPDEAAAANARMASLAAAEGLEFHMDRAQPGNTFDAHRVIHMADAVGRQGDAKERMLAAYFVEGEPVGDRDTLARLAGQVGLEPSAVRAVLDGDLLAREVRADEQLASDLGIRGVPFFVIDGRRGISGAQSAELILSVLEEAWEDRADADHPVTSPSEPDRSSSEAGR